MQKKALITGVTGQVGAYLACLLLAKNYIVHGTSRDLASPDNLIALGVLERVKLHALQPTDALAVEQLIDEVRPHEIYNLAGQSSVALSFTQPAEAVRSVVLGTLNLLEAVRRSEQPIRFYNAGSSEAFGDTLFATEKKAFCPKSVYGLAKASAANLVMNYRVNYNLFACSGLTFNHESPLRPERFVTRKITAAAARISRGSRERLQLGNISLRRDFGWTPDYVEAMWLMLNCDQQPQDYVIASGRPTALVDFVRQAFEVVGLDWQDHVDCDPTLTRPNDIEFSCGDPSKAARLLGWKPSVVFPEVVTRMVRSELQQVEMAS